MLQERLRSLRNEYNFSQQKLAELLGITQQAIAKWENGKAEPDSTTLIKLSEIFNCSIDYLLGKTNIKNYDEFETIAAHHDGEDWTEEELKDIEKFKEFVRMKRSKDI